MRQKFIPTDRGDVHYWVAGEGSEYLAFTHGATMDHGMFDRQVDHFSSRYRVITWDVCAHGLSHPYEGFTLQHAAADLANILDAEGVEKAHLVGQSMGGYIIQILALQHPKRVKSLTVIGSSPIKTTYFSGMDKFLLKITPFLLRLYPYNYLINLIADQISVSHPSKTYALETLKKMTKGEIADIMGKVYFGLESGSDAVLLSIPLLITLGDSEVTGKVRQYSLDWATNEGRPLKVIPNAAHNANVDNPDAFNAILQAFLNEIDDNPQK